MNPPDLTEYVKPVDAHISASGGYGDVWMGRLEINGATSIVAVKNVRPLGHSPADRKRMDTRLRREITVWKRLQHENVLLLLGTIDQHTSIGMVSLWMTSGNLNVFARGDLSPSHRIQITCDVAAGLAYLHSRGIIHGDLTGANVLISDQRKACLVDFGLSLIKAEFDGTSLITSTVGGAARYRAPELLPTIGTSQVYTFTPTLTFACDIWSLGGVILQTISGETPYHDIKPDVCVLLALSCGIRPHRPPSKVLTEEYWKCINNFWGDAPDSRPRADEAHTSLLALRDKYQPRASYVVPKDCHT